MKSILWWLKWIARVTTYVYLTFSPLFSHFFSYHIQGTFSCIHWCLSLSHNDFVVHFYQPFFLMLTNSFRQYYYLFNADLITKLLIIHTRAYKIYFSVWSILIVLTDELILLLLCIKFKFLIFAFHFSNKHLKLIEKFHIFYIIKINIMFGWILPFQNVSLHSKL